MFELLRKVFPDGSQAPKMLMHGWSGGADMTKMYCKHFPNMYFSFSAPLRGKQLKGGVKSVPIKRLLMETDDKRPVHIFETYNVVISHLAETKEFEETRMIAIVGDNFKALFDL